MSLKEIIEDDTSSTLENGITVSKWYYRHLDRKGKMPNYDLLESIIETGY